MIAQLSGTVLSVGASAVVIDVAGVGYRVLSTPGTLAQLRAGAPASLATHLVVREDSLTLFGFASARERDMFETLQSVQGVGPKLALAMLAVHEPDALSRAIHAGDRAALEKVPGVGAKVAARLLLELAGKLDTAGLVAERPAIADERAQVEEALVALGWNVKAAQAAVASVQGSEPVAAGDVPRVLRAALRELGGSRG